MVNTVKRLKIRERKLLREENIASFSDASGNVCRCGKLVTVGYIREEEEGGKGRGKTHSWGDTARRER